MGIGGCNLIESSQSIEGDVSGKGKFMEGSGGRAKKEMEMSFLYQSVLLVSSAKLLVFIYLQNVSRFLLQIILHGVDKFHFLSLLCSMLMSLS